MSGDDDLTMSTFEFPACEHHGLVLCDVCVSGILMTHDLVGTVGDETVSEAMAEDRESADVAARTLIDDGAELVTMHRRGDGQAVAWYSANPDGSAKCVTLFND